MVSRDHIDLLVTAAAAWNLLDIDPDVDLEADPDVDRADDVGRLMWRGNLAGVAYRYPADRDTGRPGPVPFRDSDVDEYRFRPYPGRVDPDVVGAAARSLAYQSEAHPGWVDSGACRWVIRLQVEAATRACAYAAEHGQVDLDLQPPGEASWHVFTVDGRQAVYSIDGWMVAGRDVFIRAAAVRRPATGPSGS